MRKANMKRKTLETDIKIELNLDGQGKCEIDTGVGFLDHMLTLMAFHGQMDLNLSCKGDLEVDQHHTVEDIGMVLGKTIREALKDTKGIKRYAHQFIPMDESLARVVIDMSNRPYLVFRVDFTKEKLGRMDTENFIEFFRALVVESRMTLHVECLYGENDHHKIEGIFKGFGRALKESIQIVSQRVSSSKGVL